MTAIRAALARVPVLTWYIAGGVLLAPWLARYFLAVLGQGCGWLVPPVGQ